MAVMQCIQFGLGISEVIGSIMGETHTGWLEDCVGR